MREREPERHHPTTERREQPHDRAGTAAHGARSRPPGRSGLLRGGLLLGGRTPGTRAGCLLRARAGGRGGPAARRRRGRRTGRHDTKPRRSSHPSQGQHAGAGSPARGGPTSTTRLPRHTWNPGRSPAPRQRRRMPSAEPLDLPYSCALRCRGRVRSGRHSAPADDTTHPRGDIS
ncbi:hypothetical protein KR76_00109 [Pimelobacter simplex]|uniref:Uncharacterized protein n=1 Tax=Nocardioides simplex TaxID=2045 RepID=A0A0C5XCJ3_NOCSI|nr:hypothetical protein KR76_00109 [Pimelobacter simplex]